MVKIRLPFKLLSLVFVLPLTLFLYYHLRPTSLNAYSTPASVYSPKVLLLIYNPIIESQAGRKLNEVMGWNNPDDLTQSFINSLSQASTNKLNYQIIERVEVDGYPVKSDGFQYTDDTYLNCVNSGGSACHNPDLSDYNLLIDSVDACGKLNRGEIDEVWMWGAPWFGYWESNLAGPNAFWYNSSPTLNTTCQRLLPIMGFSYERGVSEMLEDYAHRTESTMTRVYGSWEAKATHAWNRFTLLDVDVPGQGGCGNSHLGVNARSNTGYEWNSTRLVTSSCNDFLNYPNLTGTTTSLNCSAWGCNSLGYFNWWFSHLPKSDTLGSDGKLANWWAYLADPQANILDPGILTNLSADLRGTISTFTFSYSGGPNYYRIDASSSPDMSSDVYVNFSGGTSSPVMETNPTKWSYYRCDAPIYWKVYAEVEGTVVAQSSIQTSTITCDTQAPIVSITAPLNGSTVARNKSLTLKASASDNIAVTKVEFYVDNQLKCTDTTTAYTCDWLVPTKAKTSYILQAKAYDDSGNSTLSVPVKVTSR